MRIFWGFRGIIVDHNSEKIPNVSIVISPNATHVSGSRQESKSYVKNGDFYQWYYSNMKFYISFYKDGYKPVINKEFIPTKFKILSNKSKTVSFLNKVLPVKTVVMEKVEK